MERRIARNWYRWLWTSPLVTVPTLIVIAFMDPGRVWICSGGYSACDFELATRVTVLVAIFASALWHLILLLPVLNRKSNFVRWHGCQMLLLAGLRTIIPAAILGINVEDGSVFLSFVLLAAVWFFGTRWGQKQAVRGDNSLARWMGREGLMSVPGPDADERAVSPKSGSEAVVKNLVHIIRYSPNRKRYYEALTELRQYGLAAAAFEDQDGLSPESTIDQDVSHLLEVIRFQSESPQQKTALDELVRLGLATPL